MFKKRKLKKQRLKDYEEGKILQVDNGINNKDHFKKIENEQPVTNK